MEKAKHRLSPGWAALFVSVNANSLRGKLRDLQLYALEHDVIAIAVQETKLSAHIPDAQVEIPDYKLLRLDRNENGGGVALYIRKDLHPRRVSLQNLSPCLELVAATFCFRGRNVFVASAYRPPGQTAAQRDEALDTLTDFFAALGDENIRNLLFGADLNFDALDRNAFSPVQEIFDEFGLHQAVDFVTHRMRNAETALDLLAYGDQRMVGRVTSDAPLDGHHDMMLLVLRNNIQRPLPPKRKVRVWKEANWERIREECFSANFSAIVDTAPSASAAAKHLTAKFLRIVDAHIPVKNVRHNPKTLGFTPAVRRLHKRKNAAYRRWRRTDSPQQKAVFKQLLKKFRKERSKAREEAIAEMFGTVTTAAQFWDTVRRVQGNNREPIPPIVRSDGALVIGNQGKADLIADQFQAVFNRADGIIPHLPKTAVPAEFLCSEAFVLDEIANLRNRCAPGKDGIFPCMVKCASFYLAGAIAKLINRSILEGEFPSPWKETIVSPIPKVRWEPTARNFRPITLLAIFSKICEAHIFDIVRESLERSLSNRQFAYRRGRGTVDALAYHEHLICEGMERCRQKNTATNVLGVFFDVSKAFDSIPFGNLLCTLERDFDLHPSILVWLKSYLMGRTLQVKVEDCLSAPKEVLSGVPQGSRLGPLLFIAYVNSIADLELSPHAHVILYADDIAYIKAVTSVQDSTDLQNDINRIDAELTAKFLDLNAAKTKLMQFSVSPVPPEPPVLSVRGNAVERVPNFRYLGLLYDERLSWADHARVKARGLKRAVGALNAIFGKKRSHEVFRRIYVQQIFPVLSYAIQVWYPSHAQNRILLERAQKFALRTIQRDYTRNYCDLLGYSKLLPISFTAASFRCRLLYLWHSQLHFWPDPLPLTADLPLRRAARLARNDSAYEVPVYRLDRTNVSCVREAVRIWNRLPSEWVLLDKHSFYSKLKRRSVLQELVGPLSMYENFDNL